MPERGNQISIHGSDQAKALTRLGTDNAAARSADSVGGQRAWLARPKKRSLTLRGHRTSVSLEEAFWVLLKEMCRARGLSTNALVSEIDETRPQGTGLSGAVRIAILLWLAEEVDGK